MFYFYVFVQHCRGPSLPGSEHNQLCIPLKMHICAFVYSIGVHRCFIFTSEWFMRQLEAHVWCQSSSTLGRAAPWRHPLWHHRRSALWPCQSLNRCSPASSHLACRERFLWHLVIRLQWSLLAASQLNDDPVLHIEPTQRIGAPYWVRDGERESKCWLGMDAESTHDSETCVEARGWRDYSA